MKKIAILLYSIIFGSLLLITIETIGIRYDNIDYLVSTPAKYVEQFKYFEYIDSKGKKWLIYASKNKIHITEYGAIWREVVQMITSDNDPIK